MARYLSKLFIIMAFLFVLSVLFWKDLLSIFAPSVIKGLTLVHETGAHGLHYTFKDKNETAFDISVKKGKEHEKGTFGFDQIQIKATLKNGKKIEATADHAVYHPNTKIVTLRGNIHVITAQNMHLKTCAATIYVDKGYAESDEYVEVENENTQISANGFIMNDAESEIIFKNNPKFKMKTPS
ncbi:MAG: hypothetical protein CNLJKLNK_00475 [Holosporales bacterium]